MLGERKRVWYLNKIFSTVRSDCNWRVLSLWHLYTRDDIFAHVKNATHTKNISCLRISVTCISNINCHFAAFEFQTLIFSNTDKFNFLRTETKQCCYYLITLSIIIWRVQSHNIKIKLGGRWCDWELQYVPVPKFWMITSACLFQDQIVYLDFENESRRGQY